MNLGRLVRGIYRRGGAEQRRMAWPDRMRKKIYFDFLFLFMFLILLGGTIFVFLYLNNYYKNNKNNLISAGYIYF